MRKPTPDEIRSQVEAICNGALGGAPRRRDLLRYIVEGTLAGEPATEVSIALDVYKRDRTHFLSEVDSIVRVETNKLRNSLQRYYSSDAGKRAPIRISIEAYVARAKFTQDGASKASNSIEPLPYNEEATIFSTRLNERYQLQLPAAFLKSLRQGMPASGNRFFIGSGGEQEVHIFPQQTVIETEKVMLAQSIARDKSEYEDWPFPFPQVPDDETDRKITPPSFEDVYGPGAWVEMDTDCCLTIPEYLSLAKGLKCVTLLIMMASCGEPKRKFVAVMTEASWLFKHRKERTNDSGLSSR